jgi:hypothetical protein
MPNRGHRPPEGDLRNARADVRALDRSAPTRTTSLHVDDGYAPGASNVTTAALPFVIAVPITLDGSTVGETPPTSGWAAWLPSHVTLAPTETTMQLW